MPYVRTLFGTPAEDVTRSPGVGALVLQGYAPTVTDSTVYGVIFADYLGTTGWHNNAEGNPNPGDPADVNFQIAEMAFMAGASRENSGIDEVTPLGWTSGSVGDITDDSFSTFVFKSSNLAAYRNNRWYCGFDFGTPRTDMDGLKFGANVNPHLLPIQCDVIQSSDGLNWSYVAHELTWTQPSAGTYGTTESFSMEYPDAGAHIYWRISEIDNNDISNGDMDLWVSEIAVYSGVNNVTSQATMATNMSFASGTIGQWFDSSTSTPIVAFAQLSGGVIEFTFTSATRVSALRCDASSGIQSSSKYIHRCSLDYSDNGDDWTRAGRIAALTYPGDSTAGAIVRLY